MSETDYAALESARPQGDRTLMHVLYALHTAAWFSGGTLAVIALILNYIKKGDELDAVYLSHHNYMIRTFWWTLLWVAATGLLMVFVITIPLVVWVLWPVIFLWYLYRCLKGWWRFHDNRIPD